MDNQKNLSFRTAGKWPLILGLALAIACQDSTKKVSLPMSAKHVAQLVEITRDDVNEVRSGMPAGAHLLETLYKNSASPRDDLERVQVTLNRTRDKVQDLRVAKSTFFALVDSDGTILRSDRNPDALSGKNLWATVSGASEALKGKVIEIHGSMPEASGVKDKVDGQWFYLAPVVVDNTVRGAYVTGWSWSAYAYRLETALRNEQKTVARESHTKEPLVYVYLVVADKAFGAPVSPDVNATAILSQMPKVHLEGDQVWSTILEIAGRGFALSVRKAPELGSDVAVAVLRSET
jgi:hypothetical protein